MWPGARAQTAARAQLHAPYVPLSHRPRASQYSATWDSLCVCLCAPYSVRRASSSQIRAEISAEIRRDRLRVTATGPANQCAAAEGTAALEKRSEHIVRHSAPGRSAREHSRASSQTHSKVHRISAAPPRVHGKCSPSTLYRSAGTNRSACRRRRSSSRRETPSRSLPAADGAC